MSVHRGRFVTLAAVSGAQAEEYCGCTYSTRGPKMAVGIRLKFAGGTQENYDAAHGVMEIDSNPPEGMIVHSAGPVDGGWSVIDFWESREAFDNFVGERLMPRLHGLGDRGFPNPPDVREFPVHNLQTR
jgi:hypothetical protein